MKLQEIIKVILFCLSSIVLTAQETTGTLQGYILDNTGQAIEFATIQVVDEMTNSTVGGVSQYNGFYIVPNLTPSTNK